MDINSISTKVYEAENVLKYTLQLELPSIKLPSLELDPNTTCTENIIHFIDSTADETCKICECLFNHDYSNANIFKNHLYNEADLSLLSSCGRFWKHAFKQDMFLSAFAKLRKLIGQSEPLVFNQFVKLSNYTNTTLYEKNHGLDYLTGWTPSKAHPYYQLICSKENTISIDELSKATISSYCISDYDKNKIRSIKNVSEALKNIYNNFPYDEKADCIHLNYLEFFEFFGNLRNKELPIAPILSSHKEGTAFTKSDLEKYLKCIRRRLFQIKIDALSKNIRFEEEKAPIEHNLSLSDKIYLWYQIEKIFSPIMTDCLYRNIIQTLNTHFALNDQPTINTLALCFSLPNVFTRQYIVQMAVDTLIHHSKDGWEKQYFFSTYTREPVDALYHYDSRIDHLHSQTDLSLWLNRYKEFVCYLAQMMLPVLENHFFILLWNSVKKAFPKQKEAENIIYLYKLFQHFFNDEDTIDQLFSTEELLLKPVNNNYKLKSEHIIKPSFACDYTVTNANLYKKCLLSQNTAAQNTVPDFIDLPYLNSWTRLPNEYIQSFYIRAFLNH